MIDFVQSDGRSVDVLVIGGGATGLYTALDSAARGYSTVLVERGDFGSGTSSASTKLVHGGVRYLQQGRIGLVRESLRERALLRRNAPHIVRPLRLAVPAYSRWDHLKVSAGLLAYDTLARGGFGRARPMGASSFTSLMPEIESSNLRGGVVFTDGQMDDTRLAIALARTAAANGAAVLNYANVRNLRIDAGRVTGVEIEDVMTGRSLRVDARVVVNATGVYADDTIRLEGRPRNRIMRWSRGTHLVVDGALLGGGHGLLIPETSDGRVVFALPWLGRTLVGTTDIDVAGPDADPAPPREDVGFLLDELEQYLPAARGMKVLSAFTGIRPLVAEKEGAASSKIARSHRVLVSPGRLVTIAGGKWTTARAMAEETVDAAAKVAGLPPVRCTTKRLGLLGAAGSIDRDPVLERHVEHPDSLYGSDQASIADLERQHPELSVPIHDSLPYRISHAVFAMQEEMAQTLEDVLARRTRSLVLDSDAAALAAPSIAREIQRHCHVDGDWADREAATIPRMVSRFRFPD